MKVKLGRLVRVVKFYVMASSYFVHSQQCDTDTSPFRWLSIYQDAQDVHQLMNLTYNTDQLDIGQSKFHFDILGQVTDGSDERIIAWYVEQVLHEAHFVFTPKAWNEHLVDY